MKLATLRSAGGTVAVRIDDDVAVELDARDVGDLLQSLDWKGRAEAGSGTR